MGRQLQITIQTIYDEFEHFQTEANRRRETEVIKIKKDYDLAIVQHESAEASLRKRHTDSINELTDQVEFLTRGKSKLVPVQQLCHAFCIQYTFMLLT